MFQRSLGSRGFFGPAQLAPIHSAPRLASAFRAPLFPLPFMASSQTARITAPAAVMLPLGFEPPLYRKHIGPYAPPPSSAPSEITDCDARSQTSVGTLKPCCDAARSPS